MNIVEFEKVSKKFHGFWALKDCSFKVNKNSIHGLIGPNGSGKTTCIKLMLDIYRATSGEIMINGNKSISHKFLRKISYVPEKTNFYKKMSARSMLINLGVLFGLTRSDSVKHSDVLLARMNLKEHANKNPNSYSSGMKKKFMLAIALISNPEIIVLDEPAANLDPSARQEVYDLIRQIQKEGKTIIICSHILSEMESLIDEVTILCYSQVKYNNKFSHNAVNGWLIRFDEKISKSEMDQNVEKIIAAGAKVIGQNANNVLEIDFNDETIDTNKKAMEKIFKIGLEFEDVEKNQSNLQELYNKYVGEAENAKAKPTNKSSQQKGVQ